MKKTSYWMHSILKQVKRLWKETLCRLNKNNIDYFICSHFFLFYLPLTLPPLLYFASFNLSERCFSCFHSFLVNTLNIFIELFIKMFAISFTLIYRYLQIILTKKKKSKNAKTCENVVMFTKYNIKISTLIINLYKIVKLVLLKLRLRCLPVFVTGFKVSSTCS